MPHKRFQTCHAQGLIDTALSRSRPGILEKGLLRSETNKVSDSFLIDRRSQKDRCSLF